MSEGKWQGTGRNDTDESNGEGLSETAATELDPKSKGDRDPKSIPGPGAKRDEVFGTEIMSDACGTNGRLASLKLATQGSEVREKAGRGAREQNRAEICGPG